MDVRQYKYFANRPKFVRLTGTRATKSDSWPPGALENPTYDPNYVVHVKRGTAFERSGHGFLSTSTYPTVLDIVGSINMFTMFSHRC
jgi:hypothetical protein